MAKRNLQKGKKEKHTEEWPVWRQHLISRANIHIRSTLWLPSRAGDGRKLRFGYCYLTIWALFVRIPKYYQFNERNRYRLLLCMHGYILTTMPVLACHLRLTMPNHILRYEHRGWMEIVLGHTIDDNDDETIRMPARYKSVSEIHYFML